jgi:hypothetical protein
MRPPTCKSPALLLVTVLVVAATWAKLLAYGVHGYNYNSLSLCMLGHTSSQENTTPFAVGPVPGWMLLELNTRAASEFILYTRYINTTSLFFILRITDTISCDTKANGMLYPPTS